MITILPLAGHHDRKIFDCGNGELNYWLSAVAQQHRAKGLSSTYVAVESDISTEILGFYALSLTELRGDEIPLAWAKKLPQKVPVFRLGRLAISKNYQRMGLGGRLLANVISRVKKLSFEVGGVGILVDAKPSAISFYEQYGFECLADHPQKLFLRI